MDWDPTVENTPAAGAYNPTDGTGAQGSILVGDYWNYKVQRFSVNGQHLDTYNDVTGPKANGGIPSADPAPDAAQLERLRRALHDVDS